MTSTVKISALEFSLTAFKDGKAVAQYSNPRVHSSLSDQDIKELADDIALAGLRSPITVRRVTTDNADGLGGDHVLVLDGQRRVLALRMLGQVEEVPVVWANDTADGSPFTAAVATECLEDALRIGIKRAGLSSYELCRSGVELAGNDLSHDQIGQVIGRSRSWVSRMLGAYGKATQPVLDAWRENKITDEIFKDLAASPKVKQPDALEAILGQRASGDRDAISEARHTAKLNAPAPKAVAAKEARKGKVELVNPVFDSDDKDDKPPAGTASAGYQRGGKIGGAQLAHPLGGGKSPGLAPAAPKPSRPGQARLAEYAELRRAKPSRDAYVRGALDMAAFATGEIDDAGFSKPFKTYIKVVGTSSIKATPPAAVVKAKPVKAKVAAEKRPEKKAKPLPRKGKPKRAGGALARRAAKRGK